MFKFNARPWWMNGILLFCAFMTFIYLPWDIFIKPLDQDQEVWFGVLFTWWAAKFGALIHWAVYGAGFWGFLHMKSWLHPWAAVYVVQIALGMLVWSVLGGQESGIVRGLVVAGLFLGLAVALIQSKPLFKANHASNLQ